jgi:hypothetical protein
MEEIGWGGKNWWTIWDVHNNMKLPKKTTKGATTTDVPNLLEHVLCTVVGCV